MQRVLRTSFIALADDKTNSVALLDLTQLQNISSTTTTTTTTTTTKVQFKKINKKIT